MIKNIVPYTFLGLFFILFSKNAQGQVLPSDSSYYAPYEYEGIARDDKDLFSFYTSIGGGASAPMGTWGQQADLTSPLLAPLLGEDGMGATYGGYISLRQMVNLSYTSPNAWSSILHWNLEYSYNGTGLMHPDMDILVGETSSQLSFGIGTGLAYNYNNNWGFESEVSLLLPVVSTAPDYSYLANFSNDEDKEFELTPSETDMAWYPGYSISAAIRSKRWRFSVELYSIKHKGIYTYSRIDSAIDPNTAVENDFTAEFQVTTLRFGVDYLFSL